MNFIPILRGFLLIFLIFHFSTYHLSACEADLKESEKLVVDIKNHLKDFKVDEFKNKEVVIFLGPTGAGKTTLLNLISEVSLNASINSEGDWEFTGESANLVIGHGVKSKTFLPTLINIKGRYYCDCPGFGDTNGVDHDIAKSLFLKGIAENVKTTKVVTVLDWATLKAKRGSEFTCSLKDIDGFISGFNFSKDSVFIAAKAPKRINISQVEESLKSLGFNNLPPIGIFYEPEEEGPIKAINFEDLIKKAPNLTKGKYNISLSEDSITYINDLVTRLNSFIISKGVLGDLYNDFVNQCNKLIKEHSDTADKIRKKLNMQVSIEGILDFTFQKGKKDFFVRTVSVLDNIQTLTDYSKDKIHVWRGNSIIRDLIGNVKSNITKLTGITTDTSGAQGTVTGFIIGSSDIKSLLGKAGISKVSVYSLNNLFIDEDINAPGISLTLLSPQWHIVGSKTISLKGNPGTKHLGKPATEGRKGKDGLPGFPGYNGGHFFGRGKEFYNLSFLSIDVSGGQGGKGQKGGEGLKGESGRIGAFLDVKNREKHTLIERYTTEGGFIEEWGKYFLTFNGKFQEVYQSGQLAQIGGNAGKGGIGGMGGNAGCLSFQNLSPENGFKNNGMRGIDGKPGIPGEGGKINGPAYRGVYINEIVAPGVRGYRETDGNSLGNSVAGAATGGIGGAGVAAATATTHVLAESCKLVVKGSTEAILQTTTKEIYKEGGQIVLQAAGKEVARGILRDVAVNSAGQTIATVGLSTASSMASGMGLSLLTQSVLSPISSYLSSGWKEGPAELHNGGDHERAPNGKIDDSLNEKDIKEPSAVNNPINQLEEITSFNNFYSLQKESNFAQSLS